MRKLILGALAILLLATAVNAQAATGTMSATVVQAISTVETVGLNFGSFAAGGSAGTVAVSTGDGRVATGGVTLIGAAVNSGKWSVTGTQGTVYNIVLNPSSTVTSGVNTMTVDGFVSSPTPSGTLPAGGSQNVFVGATVHAAANQPAGAYSGTYTITFAQQ